MFVRNCDFCSMLLHVFCNAIVRHRQESPIALKYFILFLNWLEYLPSSYVCYTQ